MKQTRLVQNFRGARALICAASCPSVATLSTMLPRLALQPEVLAVQPGQLVTLPRVQSGDIVLLDGDMVLPECWTDAEGAEIPAPCPVVGLVGSEAPSRLRALAQLGAKAFLPKPVHGGAIYSALFLAVNEFRLISQMQGALGELHDRRNKRAHVLRAVVDLVQTQGLDADAAYDQLRRAAMRSRQSVETYCLSLHPSPDTAQGVPPTDNDKRRQA